MFQQLRSSSLFESMEIEKKEPEAIVASTTLTGKPRKYKINIQSQIYHHMSFQQNLWTQETRDKMDLMRIKLKYDFDEQVLILKPKGSSVKHLTEFTEYFLCRIRETRQALAKKLKIPPPSPLTGEALSTAAETEPEKEKKDDIKQEVKKDKPKQTTPKAKKKPATTSNVPKNVVTRKIEDVPDGDEDEKPLGSKTSSLSGHVSYSNQSTPPASVVFIQPSMDQSHHPQFTRQVPQYFMSDEYPAVLFNNQQSFYSYSTPRKPSVQQPQVAPGAMSHGQILADMQKQAEARLKHNRERNGLDDSK